MTEAICHVELSRISKRGRTLTATQALGPLAENDFHFSRSEEVVVPVINDVSRRVAIPRFHSFLDGSSQEEPADKTDACQKRYGIRFDALSRR